MKKFCKDCMHWQNEHSSCLIYQYNDNKNPVTGEEDKPNYTAEDFGKRNIFGMIIAQVNMFVTQGRLLSYNEWHLALNWDNNCKYFNDSKYKYRD